MSRSIVRGLTAAIVLVTVFCFAMPAVAAPARSHAARTSVAHGTGVFDQVLSWLDSLWLGNEPKPQGPAAKSLLDLVGDVLNNSQTLPIEPDRGAQIDPNGLH